MVSFMGHISKSVFLEVLKVLLERKWDSMGLESQSGLDPRITGCKMWGNLLSFPAAPISYVHNKVHFARIT